MLKVFYHWTHLRDFSENYMLFSRFYAHWSIWKFLWSSKFIIDGENVDLSLKNTHKYWLLVPRTVVASVIFLEFMSEWEIKLHIVFTVLSN